MALLKNCLPDIRVSSTNPKIVRVGSTKEKIETIEI